MVSNTDEDMYMTDRYDAVFKELAVWCYYQCSTNLCYESAENMKLLQISPKNILHF